MDGEESKHKEESEADTPSGSQDEPSSQSSTATLRKKKKVSWAPELDEEKVQTEELSSISGVIYEDDHEERAVQETRTGEEKEEEYAKRAGEREVNREEHTQGQDDQKVEETLTHGDRQPGEERVLEVYADWEEGEAEVGGTVIAGEVTEGEIIEWGVTEGEVVAGVVEEGEIAGGVTEGEIIAEEVTEEHVVAREVAKGETVAPEEAAAAREIAGEETERSEVGWEAVEREVEARDVYEWGVEAGEAKAEEVTEREVVAREILEGEVIGRESTGGEVVIAGKVEEGKAVQLDVLEKELVQVEIVAEGVTEGEIIAEEVTEGKVAAEEVAEGKVEAEEVEAGAAAAREIAGEETERSEVGWEAVEREVAARDVYEGGVEAEKAKAEEVTEREIEAREAVEEGVIGKVVELEIAEKKLVQMEVVEGEVIEVKVSEGEVVQGEVVEGEVIEGKVSEGEVVQGEVVEGEVIEGKVVEREVVQVEVVEREVVKAEIVEAEVIQEKVLEREVVQIEVVEGEVIELKAVDREEVEGEVVAGEVKQEEGLKSVGTVGKAKNEPSGIEKPDVEKESKEKEQIKQEAGLSGVGTSATADTKDPPPSPPPPPPPPPPMQLPKEKKAERKFGSSGSIYSGDSVEMDSQRRWQSARYRTTLQQNVVSTILPSTLRQAMRRSRHLSVSSFKPRMSESFALPEDVPFLYMVQSLGFDSLRRGNVKVLDVGVFLIVAATYLRIMDIREKRNYYLRATGAGSVACTAVHPSRKFFASGECGHDPDINIFEYPSRNRIKVLPGGTKHIYQCIAFNSGRMLVSQGGEPDYQLTVWDWESEVPMIKSRNVPHPINGVAFSSYLEGRLITYGEISVRFWYIAITFTGLKLAYEQGKFGTVDIADLHSGLELPNGKALTGTDAGNMLLWDEAVVRAEITLDNGRSLHNGKITQVSLHDGELFTLGEDGKINLWDYDAVINANPAHDGDQCFTKPVFTLDMGAHLKLTRMEPVYPNSLEVPTKDESLWYVQDAGGRIWLVDLSFSNCARQPEKLLETNGGPVLACAASTISHLVATGGADMVIRIHDCLQMKELASIKLSAAASTLLWVPESIDSFGASFVVGSQDGSVKKIVFRKPPVMKQSPKPSPKVQMSISQAFKPHTQRVTHMDFSQDGEFLATSSRDGTVFLYTIKACDLLPCGWFPVQLGVNNLQWTPLSFSYRGLLLACDDSVVMEYQIPHVRDIKVSRYLEMKTYRYRMFVMQSIKSELLYKEAKYREKVQQVLESRELRKKFLAYGMITEEQAAAGERADALKLQQEDDSEEEEDLLGQREKFTPSYPPTPSPVLHVLYDVYSEGSAWLYLGEYDADFVYHCMLPDTWTDAGVKTAPCAVMPDKSSRVPFLEDAPMTLLKFSSNGTLLCVGMKDGRVGFIQLKMAYNLSDLSAYWHMAVHDVVNGSVTGMEMGYDESFLVTTGSDGNIFLHSYCGKLQALKQSYATVPWKWDHHTVYGDDLAENALSVKKALERETEAEKREKVEFSKREKYVVLNKLKKQLTTVLQQNATLPSRVQYSRKNLLVNTNLEQENYTRTAEAIEMVKNQLAWTNEKMSIGVKKLQDAYKYEEESDIIVVKDFQNHYQAESYRIPSLLLAALIVTEGKRDSVDDDAVKIVFDSRTEQPAPKASRSDELFEQMYDGFKNGGMQGSAARRLRYSLEYVKRARDRRKARKAEWEQILSMQPSADQEDPQDVAAIELAKATIGDLVLRDSDEITQKIRVERAVRNGKKTLIRLERQIHDKMKAFNVKLVRLRDEKCTIIEIIKYMRSKLKLEDEIVVEEELCLTSMGVLNDDDIPVVPLLQENEVPEARYVYGVQELTAFKQQLVVSEAKESRTDKAHIDKNDPRSIFLEKFPQASEQKRPSSLKNKVEHHRSRIYFKDKIQLPSDAVRTFRRQTGKPEEVLESKGLLSVYSTYQPSIPVHKSSSLTPLQLELLEVHRLTMQHRRSQMMKLMADMMQAFDSHVYALKREKLELDVLLKRAELLYITRLQEFLINTVAVGEESSLQACTKKANADLNKHIKYKESLAVRIAVLSKELAELKEDSTNQFYHFQDTVRDFTIRRQKFLGRVYRKRVKVKSKLSDSDSESESSSDDDLSDDSGSDDDDSEHRRVHEPLDECPPDLQREIFEYVWRLRAKRQETDDNIAGVTLELERCRKDLERQMPLTEPLEKVARDAAMDLFQFRWTVQKQWNDLDVIVPLRVWQCMREKQRFPFTPEYVGQCMLLEAAEFKRLLDRVPGLNLEIKEHHKKFKADGEAFVVLKRSNSCLHEQVTVLQRKCDDEMTKKFGRLVPMKQLELAMANPKLEYLRDRFMRQTAQNCEEIEECNAQILDLKGKLTALTKDTTYLLYLKAGGLERMMALERKLDKTTKTLKHDLGPTRRDIERQQDMRTLKVLVARQHEEIARCKKEIEILNHKKGQVRLRPMTLTPRRLPPIPSVRRPLVSVDVRSSLHEVAQPM